MEKYDAEFALRLNVIAVAQMYQVDGSVDLLVAPVKVAECPLCPWWEYCQEQLTAGAGDVSLLPRVGWREWKIHRDHGVRDRLALAALDVRTARLVGTGIDVPEFQRLVEGLPDDTPIGDLGVVVRAKSQLTRLEDEGVSTFGDLVRLDGRTASYTGSGLSSLPEQIDLARAALGTAPIYRRRGVDHIVVPRADVEIDIDMENVEDGVYLWGALLTERVGDDLKSTYHAFAAWDPLTPEVEATNSLQFWSWLCDSRDTAVAAGRSFRAYCYNASAENTYLRRLGAAGNILGPVTAFIGSDQWVDVLRVIDNQLITGGTCGLKAIAPLAGFAWSVEDPGGGTSMLYYDKAVRSEEAHERDEARDWLLAYNRGDVEATLAIRKWLAGDGQGIPSVETLDAQFAQDRAIS